MLKKILSLMLCIALTVTLMTINTVATGVSEVIISRDFEDADYEALGTIDANSDENVQIIATADGNKVVDMKADFTDATPWAALIDHSVKDTDRPEKFVIEFDVNAIDVSSAIVVLLKNHKLPSKWMGINIFPTNFRMFEQDQESYDTIINDGIGEWYTFRITFDETKFNDSATGEHNQMNPCFTVKMRKKNETAWTSLRNPGGTYYYKNTGYRVMQSGTSHYKINPSSGYFVVGIDAAAANRFGTMTPHYQFDNINMFTEDTTIVNSAWMEANGNDATEIPDGALTAKFAVENYGGLTSAKTVLNAFDENGAFVGHKEKNISLSAGTVFAEATFDVSDIYGDAARIEVNLRTLADEPLVGATAVLGQGFEIEKSVSDADLGTEGEDGVYGFSAFDRSSYAGKIVVEGTHSTGAKTPAVIKAVGNTTDNVVYEAQINTKSDGSFKKEVLLGDCTGDDYVTVTVSAADTKSRSFVVSVFSNWDDMIADFADAESAEEVQTYIETYIGNLAAYESGKEEPTEADVESINFAEMAFIKSMNVYGDSLTNAEMIEVVLKLIDDTKAAVAFVDNFKVAQSAQTEAEKIDAIKTLITECDIIEFSTVGASNVDAICKALIDSDADTLEGIYNDFFEAYTNQKTAEEATVPSFKNISSGAGVKQFFADNFAVLGVDPELYTEDDYNVMYGVYVNENYSNLDSYAEVNDAIVFLDGYIKEYNSFIEAFTDAATVRKNWEAIRDILNAEFAYLEVELKDHSAVVNKEYLYSGLFDCDCSSLDTIENAFANAVDAQTALEIAAKDGFITIIDENSVSSYFKTYGEMMGFADVEYSDAELTVFVEVYKKFNYTAANYTEALAKTAILVEKHKVAMSFIANINEKSDAKDWKAIQALYEGDVCAELIGMDTATTDINDIRTMYTRIANGAPYVSLTGLKSAWVEAYSEQQAYEAVAGGYETFDDGLLYFDDASWNLTVQGNVVSVSGKVNGTGRNYITIQVKSGNSIIYVRQFRTEGTGEFEHQFILNPDFYTNDEAILRIGGEKVNIYTFAPFTLYSEEELQLIIDQFLEISSKNDMKAFLVENGDILGISADTDDDSKMEAMFFVYNRNKNEGKYASITDVDEMINGAVANSGMTAIMAEMQEMIDCLNALTEAANKEFGNTKGQWANIKAQVQLAIKNEWIAPKTTGRISGESSMYLKMAGKDYAYMSEVEDAYEKAHTEQYKEEEKANSKKPSGGGGGGGGGSAVNGSTLPIVSGNGAEGGKTDNLTISGETGTVEKELETNLENHPEAPFKDVNSDYSWAKDSIDRLRKYNLISGDGLGNFRPGNGITREEFLKIMLNVFAIDVDDTAVADFADVDKNGWYYGYVATACKLGIVNGYPDGSFGIGKVVSRSEMAVMVARTMDIMKIELEATNRAQAFADYDKIPDYAYHSVTRLQQAGILNGDSFGNFNGSKGLTRAEAAVVFATLFNDMNDFITYSWEKVY